LQICREIWASGGSWPDGLPRDARDGPPEAKIEIDARSLPPWQGPPEAMDAGKFVNFFWYAKRKRVTMPGPKSYTWISYGSAAKYIPEAKRLRVSTVARSSKGFMGEYKKAGSSSAMKRRKLPTGVVGGVTWGQKRNNFIARHMAQYKKNPTYRRWLAIVMWAYKPPGPIPVKGNRKTGTERSKRSKRSKRRNTKTASKKKKRKWSKSYKDRINCKRPKGFSQRAHCQSLKKKKKK